RVCLVELAAIIDISAVARATVAALGLPEQGGRLSIETLMYTLRNAQLLLILDNCEQVLDGCAQLVALSGLTTAAAKPCSASSMCSAAPEAPAAPHGSAYIGSERGVNDHYKQVANPPAW